MRRRRGLAREGMPINLRLMSSNKITLGIDLGDRHHAVCVLSAGGDIVAEKQIVTTHECLTAVVRDYPGAICVMETGTHSPWVSRLLDGFGHKVDEARAAPAPSVTALCDARQKT